MRVGNKCEALLVKLRLVYERTLEQGLSQFWTPSHAPSSILIVNSYFQFTNY